MFEVRSHLVRSQGGPKAEKIRQREQLGLCENQPHHMKLNPVIAVSALISITDISLGEDPPDKYPLRVKTAQEAEGLPIGTRIAIECMACKTLIDTM
jgi:hypothetical protein